MNADTGEIVEGQRPALPSGVGALDFTVVEFRQWMAAQSITPDELMAVTVPVPTKTNLISWAFEQDITNYGSMKDSILTRVIERREARNADIDAPEFLDGIPPMEEPPQGALATDAEDDLPDWNSKPHPNLPSAPMRAE